MCARASEGWQTALAALLGLVSTVTIVKSAATVDQLPKWAQVLVGVLNLRAIFAAAYGSWATSRAACGCRA